MGDQADCSAVADVKATLSFLKRDEQTPLDEAGLGYGRFNGTVNLGTTPPSPYPDFIERDSQRFFLEVKLDGVICDETITVTWRSLWPGWTTKDSEGLSEAQFRKKLGGMVIYENELILTTTSPNDTTHHRFRSKPLLLVTTPLDRPKTCSDGYGKTDVEPGGLGYRVLYAHPHGHVQFEWDTGSSGLLRKTIPVWNTIRLLHLEIYICEESGFDPAGDSDDRQLLIDHLDTAVALYGGFGIEVNTFLPGGMKGYKAITRPNNPTYSVCYVKKPNGKNAVPSMPSDSRDIDDLNPTNGKVIDEHARIVRYPRAYPACNPGKAIRVFYSQKNAAGNLAGKAVSEFFQADTESSVLSKEDDPDQTTSIAGWDPKPAERSLFIFVNKGLGASGKVYKAGGSFYNCGAATLAHEIGHILMPRAGIARKAGASLANQTHFTGSNADVHLMREGGTQERRRGIGLDKRIFSEENFKWPNWLFGWKYYTLHKPHGD